MRFAQKFSALSLLKSVVIIQQPPIPNHASKRLQIIFNTQPHIVASDPGWLTPGNLKTLIMLKCPRVSESHFASIGRRLPQLESLQLSVCSVRLNSLRTFPDNPIASSLREIIFTECVLPALLRVSLPEITEQFAVYVVAGSLLLRPGSYRLSMKAFMLRTAPGNNAGPAFGCSFESNPAWSIWSSNKRNAASCSAAQQIVKRLVYVISDVSSSEADSFSRCERLTNRIGAVLAEFSNLSKLVLSYNNFVDGSIATSLTHLTGLLLLDLSNCEAASDEDVRHLGGLTALKSLDLSGTRVSFQQIVLHATKGSPSSCSFSVTYICKSSCGIHYLDVFWCSYVCVLQERLLPLQ